MEEIGYILSGSSQKMIEFVVREDKKASVNGYYLIRHPTRSSGEGPVMVLVRVYKVAPYNPEMSCGRPGPVAGKKGERMKYGKLLEYEVAFAETLGYFDEEGWRSMEYSPSTWDPVLEPTSEEIARYFEQTFQLLQKAQPYLLEVGHHKDSKIPVFLDLNSLTKGHLFVAGMTRSGKSSFSINLIRKASEMRPRPHIMIIDKRGEYSPLVKYGAEVIPYYRFLSKERAMSGSYIVSRLGFDPKSSTGKLLMDSIEELRFEGKSLNAASLLEKVQSLAPILLSREQEKALRKIEWSLSMRGRFLDKEWDTLNVVEIVRRNPITIMDFSVDANVDNHLVALKEVVRRVVEHAISRRESGDFAALFVIEEAQYYAPERGLGIEVGNPDQVGTSKQLVEAISQAGGYNVGFIIMTQRPAYVMKSVVSQCNTIVCFRLMSGNDQDAILKYTEYGNEYMREYLPCLANHESLLWGLASPIPFPVIARVDVRDFPKKSGATAKESWAKMNGDIGEAPLLRSEIVVAKEAIG